MPIEKYRKFLISFAYFAVIAAIVVAVVRYAFPMLAPFLIGFAIAYLLRHLIRFLHRKLSLPYKLAAILVVLLFYGTIGWLLVFASIKLANWLIATIGMLPTMYQTHAVPFLQEVIANLQEVFHNLDPAVITTLENLGRQTVESLGSMVSTLSVTVVSALTGAASSLPGLFIKIVLMVISTFFIAIDYEKLKAFCVRQLSDPVKLLMGEIKSYVGGTLWVCIRSYALIMFITFVELSIALSLIGINHGVLVALAISIFDILPVLGTGGIMIPWTVLTAIQGNLSLALGLGLTYVAITVIRNIIEPKIVGSQLGLHPVVTLSSMFVGVQLFGVVGLFGFPIGLSLLRHLNDHGVIQIFK